MRTFFSWFRLSRLLVGILMVFFSFNILGNITASFVDTQESGGYQVYAEDATALTAGQIAAAEAAGKAAASESSDLGGILDIINLAIAAIQYLVAPLTWFAGWLLSPDWVMGDILGMRWVLHELWIMVSNIVYIIFAFLLVFIAFANIFGFQSDTYAIKQSLPKFFVGILIVPFSWFIVTGILSLTTALTVSVLEIPREVIEARSGDATGTDDSFYNKHVIPKNIELNMGMGQAGENTDEESEDGEVNPTCPEDGSNEDDCLSLSQLMSNDKATYGVLMYYGYAIFKIHELHVLEKAELEWWLKDIKSLINNFAFSIFTSVVFGILIFALIFALLTRMIMLWAIIIFSPLFGLFYFLGDKAGKIKDAMKGISIGGFISLALVPVYVSAALVFGLLMFSMVGSDDAKYNASTSVVTIWDVSDGSEAMTLYMWEGTWGLSLTLKGWKEVIGGVSTVFEEGSTFFGKLIMEIMALVILWVGVMAALKSNEITSKAVEPFSKFGESVGSLVKESPKYAPVRIPGTNKSLSVSGLSQVTDQVMQSIRSSDAERSSAMSWQISKGLWLGDMSEFNKVLVSWPRNKGKVAQADFLADILKSRWITFDEYSGNQNYRDDLAKGLSKMENITDEMINSIRNAKSSEDLAKALQEIENVVGTENFGSKWMSFGSLSDAKKTVDWFARQSSRNNKSDEKDEENEIFNSTKRYKQNASDSNIEISLNENVNFITNRKWKILDQDNWWLRSEDALAQIVAEEIAKRWVQTEDQYGMVLKQLNIDEKNNKDILEEVKKYLHKNEDDKKIFYNWVKNTKDESVIFFTEKELKEKSIKK